MMKPLAMTNCIVGWNDANDAVRFAHRILRKLHRLTLKPPLLGNPGGGFLLVRILSVLRSMVCDGYPTDATYPMTDIPFILTITR